ncbi:hypothetical protein OF83DRAFT_97171 [Amylostereum chailletii]|nr:hypothetical protein OF83DRAFT_97171 [Amylostereum chailletii]
MSDDLPIDFDNPAVRDYMSLIRLQVLTPLSLLINIATVLICSFVVTPSLGKVTSLFPAALSPYVPLIAAYILAIYVGQVGYCLILVFARKRETKNTIVKGVGFALVLSNWVMAAWAITWVFRAFLASTILLGILTLLLIYSNIALITYHVPTFKRPLDVAFIHAPMRLFLILPGALLFPYSLFVTLGLAWNPAHDDHYAKGQWAGFGVVMGVNIVGLLVIAMRRDIVWCVGATWICVSIWSDSRNSRPKPAPVYITTILFTVLHPLTLVVATLWERFIKNRRQGHIVLPPDDDETVVQSNGQHQVHRDWS